MHSRRSLPGYALGLAALAYCGATAAKGLYPTQFFSTLNGPESVVSADVNGDGHPDLIEIGTDQTIAVLINKGDGTFRSPDQYYAVGNQPNALAVADLNHDGKLDIVVINGTDNTISVLMGNGDGAFAAPTAADAAAGVATPAPTYPTGAGPISLTIADVNGNGIPDVIVANANDDTLSVFIGRGDGTFRPAVAIPTGKGPVFVTAADMNNDGKLDLLVNNNFDDTLGVLLNKGNGTFGAMTTTPLGPKLIRPYLQMMVVGDFRHDGNLGVITTTTATDGSTVIYLAGKGDGGFEPARTFVTGLQTTSLAVADVNGDGLPDLIAGSVANATVRVLLGNSNGGFSTGQDYPASGVSTGSSAQSMTLADFSGTGKPDIAVVNTGGSFMQLIYNDGTGHFHLRNSYSTGATPSDVETADLNGDGHLDLVETDSADGTLGVRLGNGDGTFQALQTYKVGANPQRVLLVDVDRDGILDAVTVNAGAASSSGDGTVSVLLGDGLGHFGTAHDFSAGPNPVDIAAGDMDHDGKLDLVVANAVANGVSILRGKGNGSFMAPVRYFAETQVNGLAVGDLEHSGFPDVVTVGSNVAVLRNDGKGGLKTLALNPNGSSVDLYRAIGVRVTLADVDHDGQLDMLIADSSNSQLVVLRGNRLGYFTRTTSQFPTCGNPRSLALADLNADDNVDVVVSCGGSGALGVMLGNGQGGFLSTPYPAEIEPRGVAIGDFDEDGQPDLAVVNGASDNLNVLTEIHGVVASDRAPRAASSTLTIANGRNPENGGFTAIDPDGDTLVYVAVTLPTLGSFSYSTTEGSFTYLANTGQVGTDTAVFQVSDGVKLSNLATVSIDIQTNPTGSSSSHGFLGAFWLPLLPLLGLFVARRRRRS
ncbi:MAG TPA: FG-GAP-like repeat-containing protein [Gammaproteobacteria bacterium]|nr:FG-GAP-like repeat-containing protein [Gammaproteobacteria bacterium]